ncbi:MAG: DUF1232 domain-containing protein [Aeromicrobium erythreum]
MSGLLTAVAVLAGAWLLFVGALVVTRPRGLSAREALALVPDVLGLLGRLLRDSDAPRGTRWRVGLLLGYLALPIDLVPDVLPVVGQLDDVVVAVWVLRGVLRRAGPDLLRRHWRGSEAGWSALLALLGR